MSQYDLVIRSGSVIDGTGQQPFAADVAIKNGKIAATGRVSGHGDREVNKTEHGGYTGICRYPYTL